MQPIIITASPNVPELPDIWAQAYSDATPFPFYDISTTNFTSDFFVAAAGHSPPRLNIIGDNVHDSAARLGRVLDICANQGDFSHVLSPHRVLEVCVVSDLKHCAMY